MKKRTLSLALALTLVFSLFAGMTTAASASNYTYGYNKYTAPGSSDYAYWNGSKVVKASGTTTSEIKWMQAALNYCIKYKGLSASYLDVDGSFGPASKKATLAFQKKYGLSQDGSFGPATIAKMTSVLEPIPDNTQKTTSSTSTSSKSTTTTTVSSSNSAKVEKAIAQMEAWANDNRYGYKWNGWGPLEYDCGHAVISAWEAAGVKVKSAGASYTGDMCSAFKKCGFKDVTSQVNLSTGAGLKRGDVLLNTVHHAAMYCGNGKMVQASQDYDGVPGDSSGKEFWITSYRNYPWNYVLRLT